MPETASGVAFGFGFLAATALLHAAGIGLGGVAAGTRRTVVAPMLGGAVASLRRRCCSPSHFYQFQVRPPAGQAPAGRFDLARICELIFRYR